MPIRNVAILGATGKVGQRLIVLLSKYHDIRIVALGASVESAGKTYEEAVLGRWTMNEPIPDSVKNIVVRNIYDIEYFGSHAEVVFSAVELNDKQELRNLEESFARAELVVISAASAHRSTPDVPMIIPHINPEHLLVIAAQRTRLGTKRGFIVVKSNCTLQPFVTAIHPLLEFQPFQVGIATYQAVSGAGKTLAEWPEMLDNVIPFIAGEEKKTEEEPLKIWGRVSGKIIVPAASPRISAHCFRVPVSDGHMVAVSVRFIKKPTREEILTRWQDFEGSSEYLRLIHKPLIYFSEENRPQTRLDRDFGDGLVVSLGQLREDSIFDWKFAALSHNTMLGAAGGAVLLLKLLDRDGYL